MAPYITDTGKENLQRGIKKMERTMSRAAQVRRSFRLGRPPKPGEALPLHPAVVWQRATDALANLRSRMSAAALDPAHVTADIVYIEESNPTTPRFLSVDRADRTTEQLRTDAFDRLAKGDAIAIGMVFRQFDEQMKQQFTFPYQFTGLNETGVAVLRLAATVQFAATEATKKAH